MPVSHDDEFPVIASLTTGNAGSKGFIPDDLIWED